MHSEQIEALRLLLTSPKNILVIPHINPDGDALGSALGLGLYLKKIGHEATVLAPNAFPEFYQWMPGAADIVVCDQNDTRQAEMLQKAEVVFCLDFNDRKRAGEYLGKFLADTKALIVMIDHHRQPTGFAKISISDHTKSSTSEMVYDTIASLGGDSEIDSNIAACLYTGIITDTGGFRFSSTKCDTHRTAARLLETGMRPDEVYTNVYDTNSIERMRLIGYALSEKLTIIPNTDASYIALTQSELESFDFKKGDTEGLVNYGLGIKGIRVTAFFREDRGKVKLSLRSKGDFDVNTLARKYFNGGGHKNAAGGRMDCTIQETIALYTKIMHEYAPALVK